MGAITGAVSGAMNPKFCFMAGTMVLTDQGLRTIEVIKSGDNVLSTNTNTGETEFKEVVEAFTSIHQNLVDIHIGKEVITTTMEHPFFVNSVEWKEACKLSANDALRNKDGIIVYIDEIKIYEVQNNAKLYNLEVEGFHTYFVGQCSLLVHNSCAKNGSPKGAGRKGAFKQAKRDAGIPTGQQPQRVLQNVNRQGKVVPGKVYDFGNVKITDDLAGHIFADGTKVARHFNLTIGKLRSKLHYFY